MLYNTLVNCHPLLSPIKDPHMTPEPHRILHAGTGPIQACYPEPVNVGSIPSVPASSSLSLHMYVEDHPPASHLALCISPCFCHCIFHLRSCDLLIPVSDPCAKPPSIQPVISRIRVPLIIFNHAQLGGAVGIFSLTQHSFIPQLDFSEDNHCTSAC